MNGFVVKRGGDGVDEVEVGSDGGGVEMVEIVRW